MDNKQENGFRYKHLLVGLVIGSVVTLITLFLFAVVMYLVGLDGKFSSPLASVGLAFGVFTAGFYSAKKEGRRGIFNGLVSAIAMFVIITIISIGVSTDKFGLLTLIHLVVMLLSGAIGGICGVNTGYKKRI